MNKMFNFYSTKFADFGLLGLVILNAGNYFDQQRFNLNKN